MKKLQRIQPTDSHDTNAPVPVLLPVSRRNYFIAVIAMLLVSGVLVALILSIGPALSANGTPESNDDGTFVPENGAIPLPGDSPAVDDLVATTPNGDAGTSEPNGESQGNTAGADKPDKAPVIIEQILLSGSTGLSFRSNGDGTCTLEGIGDCTDAFLLVPERAPSGDRVTSIAASAFADCSQLRAVQLPASLQSIGARAFEGCSNVAMFYVAPGSTAYISIDGVLYSKDGTTLLAYPAGRPTEVASIPAKVREIGAMAFCASPRLRSIHFEGSLAVWRSVAIGEGNEVLYTLPKTFE